MKRPYQLIMTFGILIALSQVSLGCSTTDTTDKVSSQCNHLIMAKAYQEALEDCTQDLIHGSNSASDYVRRGYVRTQLGKYDEAIEDYTQALFIQPDALLVYNHRCVAYYLAGKYGDAIADCNQALSLKPDFAGSYFNRGRARAALRNKKGALEDYHEAAKLFLKAGNKESYQAVLEEQKKVETP